MLCSTFATLMLQNALVFKAISDTNQLPECPRNLIIVSKTRKPYRGKDGNMKEGTFSNVYFHLSEKCVKKQDPYLITSLVFCYSDLKWHFLNIANACQQQASSLNWHFVLLLFKKKQTLCFNVTEQRFIGCLNELGPRTAKLALSICQKMKMVEYV